MDATLQATSEGDGKLPSSDAAVRVEIEADPTIGYASIQNAVPVVRSLRITNCGEHPLEGIELVLTCNPSFARGTKLRFERLDPSEARVITPLDLHPDHAYLSDLQEGVSASITITVMRGNEEVARHAQPISVLAYDQWAGTRALPELLAAFSMPNNPSVDQLVGKASKLLRKSHADLSMDGYQSKSRDVVWKQVSALYSTIAAENLQYVEPPASFGNDGQKIRTPDRILDSKVATCLDLAMLFASCLEQAGLRPVVMFKRGHAWVGVWLHQTAFAHALVDDPQEIRKRIASGEFLAFETTGVALHHSHRPSLRIALEQGHAHLQDDADFLFAVDVFMARAVQIRPLPSRVVTARSTAIESVDDPVEIEQPPELPPLDALMLAPIEIGAEDSPEGRLAKWKAKLLDLTLRNRLLNFKTSKSTLQLVAPDLGALEDGLADGAEFQIKPLPGLMEGTDPRVAQVHSARSGRSPLDDMARDSLGNKTLIAKVSADALDGNLLSLHTAARTGMEEGGANTLYLALGLLRWTEAEKAEAVHLAPILLVPVSLSRQSVRSGYKLTRHDDETIINPTLLQLLKSAFEINIAGLEVVHSDDKGVDVPRILQAFRLATRELPKWEVREEAHIGIFSFTKYLMWKDLQDRTEQLKGNRVVKHLIENPGQAFPDDRALDGSERQQRLDDAYRPQDIRAPMLSDSSQFEAICAVDSGRDLVLEGPPGTGKSQTITNIIANCLAKGKTVLFVAEKVAALEVVHRRLSDVGLAPFCLELHSSKTKKSEVLAQLGKALEVSGARTAEEWDREAERLATLRSELNNLVDTLHHEHANGLNVFSAIGTCISHVGEPASAMPWADANTHSRADLEKLRETARRITALGQALKTFHDHPLRLLSQSAWSTAWQDALETAIAEVSAAAAELKAKTEPWAILLGQAPSGQSIETFSALDALADLVLAAPKVPSQLAAHAHDSVVRTKVQALVRHGRVRQEHWELVGDGWSPQLAKLNATELQGQWHQAANSWWPKSWFDKRGVLAKLAAVRVDGKPPTAQALEAAFLPLTTVNEEDLILRGMHAEAEVLLEDAYSGVQTDWSAVEAHGVWAKNFADAVTRAAGSDVALADAMRATLTSLVGGNRVMLSPLGTVGQRLIAYRDAHREFKNKIAQLVELAKPTESLVGETFADGAIERLLSHLSGWSQARRGLQQWCVWRGVREEAISLGLQGLVASLEAGQVGIDSVANHFEYSYRSWWLKRTVDNDAQLRSFSSSDHERKIREFRDADTRFQRLTQDYIAATLSGRVPSSTSIAIGAESEMGKLRRELQKQRRHMPVRQLMQGLPTLLPKLKPCLLMSPLSVAQYLAAGHSQFDVVVFDEASQIAVWDAVGVIARGKQLVVVGDPKQLPPTNFFGRSTDDGDGTDEQQIEDLESILNECLGAGMNRLTLKWHYRSRHESLIAFSNVRYYESELVTFPSPVTDDVAVRFVPVAGVYDRGGSRTNRAEAEAIVDAIEKHYLKEGSDGLTMGVVTFNQTQQSLIATLLEARRTKNARLDKLLSQKVSEELFIKNLENVQGDERDIILFSITYGPDAAGKVTMNFGPLNGEGGHRRLNVAISRARHGVVIFSTLKPEQIDLARVRAAGVRDLKHYLEFAKRGPRALVEQSVPTGLAPDSPFETAVIGLLRDKGWVVHPQVGCSGYRVDLGVVDPRAPGRYLLGVECDGATYHSAATARDRDRLRQHILEGLGWRIHRIWSTDWWLDSQRELEKLLGKLELLASSAEDPTEAAPPETREDDEVMTRESAQGDGSPATGDLGEVLSHPSKVDIQAAAAVSSAPTMILPTYSVAFLPVGAPDAFYENSSNAVLSQHLSLVIGTEGPIPEAQLFKRVARAWGLERTGSRIVERLRKLAPTSAPRTTEGDQTFYWPDGIDIASWRRFRIAGDEPASRRHVDDVALQEVGSLMLHILDEGGRTSSGELARTACKMLGMSRVTAESEARAMQALSMMAQLGALTIDGEDVTIRTLN